MKPFLFTSHHRIFTNKVFRFQNAASLKNVFDASAVDISMLLIHPILPKKMNSKQVIGVKLATIRLSEIKYGYVHLYT